MARGRLLRFAGILVSAWLIAAAVHLAASTLPASLTDKEFWRLVVDLSEPDGSFRSDNLLSNELRLQHVFPGLARVVKPGGVYMGVGPEQNFTYISALKPAMAFIVDIRRGNLDLHLMYKALFELSADRSEFVSRLFSRPRPDGIDADASAADLFAAYAKAPADPELFDANLAAVRQRLVSRHGFALSGDDLGGIEYVYRAFYRFGPELRYSSTGGVGGYVEPSYAELMKATDAAGHAYSYLSSEASFAVLKGLESRNLVIPVIGNFAGPKTIRAVGQYVKERDAIVSAFYLSNVEQYLWRDGLMGVFCANVATLPLDDSSTFIHVVRGRPRVGLVPQLGPMADEVRGCRLD